MSVLLFFLLFYVLLSASLYPLFAKAGREAWKALVPGYNFVVWCDLIGRPGWWASLLLIPLVNIFIFAGMAVDMVRSFGRYRLRDSALAVLYAPIAFFLIARDSEQQYVGKTVELEKAYAKEMEAAAKNKNERELKRLRAKNPYKKSPTREWVEAIVFAVFAAAFIRMFLIEAYVIPTPSMEGSLLVGDFLFVSKAHYGIRTPMTVLQLPLIHNQVPLLGTESYLKSPELKYNRLPKITDVERNDPVVFNYPEGDSVYVTPSRTYSVYDIRRGANIPQLSSIPNNYPLKVRPIDKKDHYIKRCIGLPGDKLHIRDAQVYLNDEVVDTPKNLQLMYRVSSSTTNFKRALPGLGVNLTEIARYQKTPGQGLYPLDQSQVEALRKLGDDVVVERFARPSGSLFPHDPVNFPNWTIDNYGPVAIPKSGESIVITPK
ncbi:MAG: S26 family signal peptidase, partial [Bacteroidota bacterium]